MAPARTVPNPCPLQAATRLAPWPPASGTPADSKGPRCTVGATSMGRRVLRNGSINSSSSPVAVSGGLAFATLTAGDEHTCGVTTAGATYCWGDNTYGQLGNGAPARSMVPIAIQGDPTFRALAAGSNHTCGLTGTGTVSCWGDGYFGQLGRGTFGYTTAPAPIAPLASPAARLTALRARATLKS